MVDLAGLFRRAKRKGADLAHETPDAAKRAVHEARSTAGAVGEVLDERTDGRFGEAVAKGGEVVGAVTQKPGQLRDAFREEVSADAPPPESYRPDPIDPPEPIDRPEPI